MVAGFSAAAKAKMQEELARDVGGDNGLEQEILAGTPAKGVAKDHGIVPVPDDPIMWIMQAPIRLFTHLQAMKTELQETTNISEAARLVKGMTFDEFCEYVCALQYKGIPVFNPNAETEEERYPYVKIVRDVCRHYHLDDDVRDSLENARLCEEANMLNFDLKFKAGETGTFYYGKFLAANISGKIDFCFMFYRLKFKIAPDIMETKHVDKFLWFTLKTWKTSSKKEVALSQEDLEDFQNFFRLRMFELLGGEIKGLADTEPPARV